MKLINQSFEIIEQPNTEIGLFKHIEKACRLCYKSEDKISDTSYQRFLAMIRNNKHYSPWEHGTVYMKLNSKTDKADFDHLYRVLNNKPWVRMKWNDDEDWYITTNYRALIENKLEHIYDKYKCQPTENHVKRVTVKFITSRAIANEMVRHRVFSFCQESQRYCAYNKDKYNNEVTFINPPKNIKSGVYSTNYFTEENVLREDSPEDYFILQLIMAESSYFILLNKGWKPEEARDVLPNATKTEIMMTGFIDDWKHFFDLRCSKAAHPQMRELACGLREEFIKRNYITK